MTDISEAPELLPCPFCGGPGELKWADGGSAMNWVQCCDCGAKGPWARVGHDGSGVRNWNTRTVDPGSITLSADEARMVREALDKSRIAIDDWLNLHLEGFCDEARVAEAKARVFENGSAWYIATIQEVNRAALAILNKGE